MILAGEKTVTWRLWDDKGIQTGDNVELVNWETGDTFSAATVTKAYEKPMGQLQPEDMAGHEKFKSDQEMYATYSRYYGRQVGPETIVKIIKLSLK